LAASSMLPVTCRYLNQSQQTPLVALQLFDPGPVVWCKLEFLNPSGSTKDRIAHFILEKAWRQGDIGPGSLVVEASSGSTSIAMALTCAQLGLRFAAIMPEGVSNERSLMIRSYGGEVVFSPKSEGIRGALAQAEIVARERKGYLPRQFANLDNANAHRTQTAREILMQIPGGVVDAVVSGVGTGGTLTGVGSVLKPRRPQLKMIAVEPEDSAVLSGGPPGPHRIQGIGAGFIPEILDTELIDEIVCIGNDTAIRTAREAARLEALTVGISSGAALAAALEVGKRAEMAGKTMVVVLPDFAERYLSTALFEGL
jgi:cysteine synthase